MADAKLSMSHILANNGDRNLMLVSISMFSGSKKPNRINIICLSLVLFKMAATLFQNGCHVRSDVASSSHAVQAVRFPFPANGEVTSHSVKARNAERPPHLALPRA